MSGCTVPSRLVPLACTSRAAWSAVVATTIAWRAQKPQVVSPYPDT